MQIKKVAVNITERDITSMVETICKETQSTKKANNIADLFTKPLPGGEKRTKFVKMLLHHIT